MVKSARRAFELLEHLDDVQGGLTIMELARRMIAPQSSISALTSSLTELGYLTYDRKSRVFRPTARVALLGSWIYTPLFGEGQLHRLMEDLRHKTGEKIILATRTGLMVRSIHSIQGSDFSGPSFRLGPPRSIARSAFGCLFLSDYPDKKIVLLVRRINAERQVNTPSINIDELLERVCEIRKTGYAFAAGILTPGIYILSTLLPTLQNEPPLAVGIGSLSSSFRDRRDSYLSELKTAVREYLSSTDNKNLTAPRTGKKRNQRTARNK